MELSLKQKFGDTTQEYITAIEGIIEQVKCLSESISNTSPILTKDDYVRVSAFSATLTTLCDYCNAVIQNYYQYENVLKK